MSRVHPLAFHALGTREFSNLDTRETFEATNNPALDIVSNSRTVRPRRRSRLTCARFHADSWRRVYTSLLLSATANTGKRLSFCSFTTRFDRSVSLKGLLFFVMAVFCCAIRKRFVERFVTFPRFAVFNALVPQYFSISASFYLPTQITSSACCARREDQWRSLRDTSRLRGSAFARETTVVPCAARTWKIEPTTSYFRIYFARYWILGKKRNILHVILPNFFCVFREIQALF